MSLSERDQRALKYLAAAAVVAGAVYFWPDGSGTATVAASSTPQMLEQRLERSRKLMVALPDKQAAMKQVEADLALREKGLLTADTAAQAQAQLFQILRRVGQAQGPPVEIRANEIGQARPFGEHYGEVSVSVSMECGIEQLVNLLADLGAQPELLATSEIRIGGASGNEKKIPVRLTVSALVPRKLIPDKKGAAY
jgi:hypothetical protein